MLLITIILVFWYLWRLGKKIERRKAAGKKLSWWLRFWDGPTRPFNQPWDYD